MKINTHDLSNIAQPRKMHNKRSDSTTGQFGALLEKAMTPQNGQASATSAPPPIQNLSSLSFVVPTAVDRSQTVNQIDELLNVVESYRTKMADPTVSLKAIYPLVEQMEKKTAELAPAVEALPEGDKLKEILNRVLVTSTVEIIKFNRGDYV